MFRSIITVLAFVVGSVGVSTEVLAQFSYGFGGNSGRRSSMGHGGQGGTFSTGGGGGGISIGFGPGGIEVGGGHPNRSWGSTHPNSSGSCNTGGCSSRQQTRSYPVPRQQEWSTPAPRQPNWQGNRRPVVVQPFAPAPVVEMPSAPAPPVVTVPRNTVPEKPQPPTRVRPNVIPETPKLPPPAVNPHENAMELCGRQITPEEMDRAKKFFQDRLLELADRLNRRIPAVECDEGALVQLMTRHGVPGDIQIRIFDFLKSGDCENAERLWRGVLPKCAVPFHPCPSSERLQKFRLAIQQGRPVCGELESLIGGLPAEIRQTRGCCSADDLVAQLEEEAHINDAIAAEPARPFVPVSLPRSSGSSQQLGQTVQLPTGIVNVVHHPKLPEGSTAIVNSQLVMIGTGGRGTFRMESGYVAEVLGYRIETGIAVPARAAELVRSGILLMNPTQASVNFVVDNREMSLEPGYQQTIKTHNKATISFDSGAGRKTIRYTLKPGTYRFGISDGSLNLGRLTCKVAIDNGENTTPFQYIVQGEHATAEPGQTNTHTSDYPIVIRFDRGNGAATKQLHHDKQDGTLYAAVNAADNLWDLFDADAGPIEATPMVQRESNYIPAF